ncbi:hypothetical protein VP1G_03593 [Cytospora mali]|uniref:Glycine-rich cell wall structural protein 1 n=1 Tax=Cytospora mali TaxID=578113 RepID=A0A194UXE8_CYTMA|nr:hypothetical protein VP1G_03593 [Valsa mali var. pyri (nom. inval.)]
METINNLANTAAKAVWGDSNTNTADTTNTNTTTTESVHPGTETTHNETKGTEPVSGKLGDTSKGEPFDAGNMETGATRDLKPSEGVPADNPSTASLAGVSIDDTNQTTTSSTKGPTTEHPSTTGDTGFKAAQADIRDPESSATTDPKTEHARQNVDDTGDLDTSANPDKVDGPGPKPIEEVAHERGGDAAAVSGASGSAGGAGAAEDAEEDGPGAKSKGEGTGEQYVKSSGLAADGGDFDATKPGAGREADRLLGEKGIVKPTAAANETAHKGEEDSHEKVSSDKASTESPDSKEKKPGLKDKIKAKLHKN